MKSEPPLGQARELLDSSPSPGVTPGVVFVLAAGGVRHLDRSGHGFLGYPQREVFWKDALALVHDEDLPLAEAMISRVIRCPGASLSTGLRFRDASGAWRLMDTCIQNVLEAPGDAGLVVVNLRDAPWRESTG